MSLRLRYHLSLLPLFLGLAAAGIAVGFIVNRREVAWGLSEEAKSRAITLAAFLKPDGPIDPALEAKRQEALAAKLSSAEGGLTAVVFERDGRAWRERRLVASHDLSVPAAPDDAAIESLREGKAVARLRRRSDRVHDEVVAYAGVLNGDNTLAAAVGVTARDHVSRAELRRLWAAGSWFAGAALLSSLSLAEFLTRRARRDLGSLSAGTDALAHGDYGHRWHRSAVREIDELGTTLQAIGRILRDNASHTRRHFLRSEQLPSDHEIAGAFHHVRSTALPTAPAPSCAMRRIGGGGNDDFWRLVRTDSAWHVITGELHVDKPEPVRLERVVRADSAAEYLSTRLAKGNPSESLRSLNSVFATTRGATASIADTGEVRFVEAEMGMCSGFECGETDRELHAVGTLSPVAMAFARDYLRNTPASSISRAADELASLMADRHAGILIVFCTRARR